MSTSTSSPTSDPAPPPDLCPDASTEVFSTESSERTTRDDGHGRRSTSTSAVNNANLLSTNSSQEAVLEEDSGRNSETSSSAPPQLNDATISARPRPEGEVAGAKTTNGKQDEKASSSGTATAPTSKGHRKKRDPNAWVNGRREQQAPDAAPAPTAPPGADVHVVQQQEVLCKTM